MNKTNQFQLKADGSVERVGPFGSYVPTVKASSKTEAVAKFLSFAFRAWQDREDQIAANWQALVDAGHTSQQIANRELAKKTGEGNAPRVHYQTGRGTLCSLDNDASIRTHTEDKTTVTCGYCQNLLILNKA